MSSYASLGLSGVSLTLGLVNSRSINDLSEKVKELKSNIVPEETKLDPVLIPEPTNIPGVDNDLDVLNNDNTEIINIEKRIESLEKAILSMETTKDTLSSLKIEDEALSTESKRLEVEVKDLLLDIENLVDMKPDIDDILYKWQSMSTRASLVTNETGDEILNISQCKLGLHQDSSIHFNGIEDTDWTMKKSEDALRVRVGEGVDKGFIVESMNNSAIKGVFSVSSDDGSVTMGSAVIRDVSKGRSGFSHVGHSNDPLGYAVSQEDTGRTTVNSATGEYIHMCINGEPRVYIGSLSENSASMGIKNGSNTNSTYFDKDGENVIVSRSGASTRFRTGDSIVDNLAVSNTGVRVNGTLKVGDTNVKQTIENLFNRLVNVETTLNVQKQSELDSLSNPEITDGFTSLENSSDGSPSVPLITGPDGTYSMVRIYTNGTDPLSMAQVEIFDKNLSNVARDPSKVFDVWQQDTNAGGVASRAVDGSIDGSFSQGGVTHTHGGRKYWRISFKEQVPIKAIRVYNRTDCCSDRLEGAQVELVSNSIVKSVKLLKNLPKQTLYY